MLNFPGNISHIYTSQLQTMKFLITAVKLNFETAIFFLFFDHAQQNNAFTILCFDTKTEFRSLLQCLHSV